MPRSASVSEEHQSMASFSTIALPENLLRPLDGIFDKKKNGIGHISDAQTQRQKEDYFLAL